MKRARSTHTRRWLTVTIVIVAPLLGVAIFTGLRGTAESELRQSRQRDSVGLRCLWGLIDSCCYPGLYDALQLRDLTYSTEELAERCPCIGENFQKGAAFMFLRRSPDPGRPDLWIEELGCEIALDQVFVRRGTHTEAAGVLGHSRSTMESYLLFHNEHGWYFVGGTKSWMRCERFEIPDWLLELVREIPSSGRINRGGEK